MKYLENSINFVIKHYILAVPLFISTVLASLLGSSSTGIANIIGRLFNQLKNGADFFTRPSAIIGFFTASAIISGVGLINLILKLAVTPATYGMVNKALDEGYATLNDFVPQLKNNFAKYLIYWLGNIAISLLLVIAIILIGLLGALFTAIVKFAAIRFLFALFMFILLLAGTIFIQVNMTLWFPSMVVDNLDVISALKRSFSIVMKNFWLILGIILLISLVASLVNFILGVLGVIPLIGPIILSIAPTLSTFLITTFCLMFYKDQQVNYS
jgi:hypothetical protein